MIGNTNALGVTTITGGGGADKIYVENCLSLPVEAGRQVLVNMNLTDEDLMLSYSADGSSGYGMVLDNGVFARGDNIYRYQAGADSATVVGAVDLFVASNPYFYMNPNVHKLQVLYTTSDCVYEVSPNGSRKVGYFYLGDGLCICESKVYRCNVMEGKLKEELYQLPITFTIRNNFNGYAYFDKKLFVTNSTSIYQIDFSDLDNIHIIRSATGLGKVNYFHGFTGGDVGDYVFGRAGGALVMYRLTEDGFVLLSEDDGLPECLCGVTLAMDGNTLFYNQVTNVLTFLQSTLRFKAFSFNPETKTFTEIGLNEEVATVTSYQNRAWAILSISPDRNLISKCYESTRYQTAMCVYVNSNFDGKLKAYDSNSFNYRSNSLTGVLTGNVNEDGLVEVELIAPKEVNLTVEVLPEPDVFQIKGGIQ